MYCCFFCFPLDETRLPLAADDVVVDNDDEDGGSRTRVQICFAHKNHNNKN